MKRLHFAVRATRPRWWLLAAGVLVAGASCRQQPAPGGEGRAQGPRPTPALSRGILATSPADLLAYARTLQFDTTRPAEAAQYLVSGRRGNLVVGPFAQLAPEIGAASIEARVAGEGRILARLTLDRPSPDLGLPVGVTYFGVDDSAGAMRAVLVSESESLAVRTVPLEMRPRLMTGRGCASSAWVEMMYDTSGTMMTQPCFPCDHSICCPHVAPQVQSPAPAARTPRSAARKPSGH